MALGANLTTKNGLHIRALFWKYLVVGVGGNRLGRPRRAKNPTFLSKFGAPVSNVAADAPDRVGQICYDWQGKDLYLSTAFVSTTNHTWLRMDP